METGTPVSLLLAGIAFTGGHFLLSSTPLRGRLAARLGEKGFQGLFSVLSLAALIWLIAAYAQAPFIPWWPTPEWARWLAVLIMPFALLLFFGALRPDNPTSAGAGASTEAVTTGVFAITRHPMMWGFTLWAAPHVLANGDAASVIFFGGFLALAFFGTFAIDAKLKRNHPQRWVILARATSNPPFLALIEGRARLEPRRLVRPAILALIGWALLLAAHGKLFGVTPLGG